MRPRPNPEKFMGTLKTPREMAAMLGWSSDTLNRRARTGRLPGGSVIRTPGGHRRYDAGLMLKADQEGMWR